MEFCDGGTIADVYSELQCGFTEPVIKTITKEVFEGLAYLHQNGYIHRDIKGGNVIMKADGAVKLSLLFSY